MNSGCPQCNVDQVCEYCVVVSSCLLNCRLQFSFSLLLVVNGAGDKGVLQTCVCCAIWHYVHKGQELDSNGKYPDWTPMPTTIDLSAKELD